MSFDAAQLGAIAPLLCVLGGGIVLLLLEAFAGGQKRQYLMPLTIVVVIAAFALELLRAGEANTIFDGLLVEDGMATFLDCTFLVAAGLSALLAGPFMREHRFEFGEFYPLMLFATAGMMILAAAADLLTVFLGIETMSIAVYVLAGSWRRSAKSSEAAMKYFVNGAFAAALLLYAIALIYGSSGSTNLKQIAANPHAMTQPLFVIGILLLIVALGFKIAAVPFHMWAPDTYEGAPTPVTAYMAAGVKAAAFGAIIRIFATAFQRTEVAFGAAGWASVLAVIAVLTMTLGNLAALKQENVKRLLAYSSIAHAGYLLIGVVALATVGDDARGPLLFYLVAYTFTTIGAFGVVAWLGNRGDERLQVDDWAGLASRHPAAALAMTVFMLSLGGIPPTAGFFAKFYLFRVALEKTGLLPLVIIAVLNSVVSVYYYLRVVTAMYFREVGREPQPIEAAAMSTALWIAVVATLVLGILPGWFLDAATKAVLGG